MAKDIALVATRLRIKNVAIRGAFSADRFPSVEIFVGNIHERLCNLDDLGLSQSLAP